MSDKPRAFQKKIYFLKIGRIKLVVFITPHAKHIHPSRLNVSIDNLQGPN